MKSPRRSIPSAQELESVAATLAVPLGIEIEPQWLGGVAQQLQISLQMAALLETVPLGEEIEAAPVYSL